VAEVSPAVGLEAGGFRKSGTSALGAARPERQGGILPGDQEIAGKRIEAQDGGGSHRGLSACGVSGILILLLADQVIRA